MPKSISADAWRQGLRVAAAGAGAALFTCAALAWTGAFANPLPVGAPLGAALGAGLFLAGLWSPRRGLRDVVDAAAASPPGLGEPPAPPD